jgi:membrane-bound lytic murein transglycosylase D
LGTVFPASGVVKKQAWFWEQVFGRYSSDITLLHDAVFPHFIIDVIDFNWLSKEFNKGRRYSARDREIIVRRYIARYELAINRFKQEGKDALKHGAMEKRVYQVYGRHTDEWVAMLKRPITLRGQQGMATDFNAAADRSKKYLPYMEAIFKSHGLPIELTRIAFVESMFNTNALSKVGASGIWQFMPQTGREYLIINHYIDERNSPLKATRAAAQLLKDNYKQLKSWPLAVTAYNHGAGGMARAVKRTGSADLDKIIRNYRGRNFGFASRNFYSEFLAVQKIYGQKYRERRNTELPQLTELTISKMSLRELIESTPLDRETIEKYNSCLKPAAFDRYGRTPLPKNYSILVPRHIAQQIASKPSNSNIKQGFAWLE